jgi:hypothetical protein
MLVQHCCGGIWELLGLSPLPSERVLTATAALSEVHWPGRVVALDDALKMKSADPCTDDHKSTGSIHQGPSNSGKLIHLPVC